MGSYESKPTISENDEKLQRRIKFEMKKKKDKKKGKWDDESDEDYEHYSN
jgi:hypothetical protein